MKPKVFLSFFVVFFSVFAVRCGNTPDPLTEAEQSVYSDLTKIRAALFQEVDKKEWSLVLVGKNETLIKDLCGDEESCDYVETDLEKLVPEGAIYDSLDEPVKEIIIASNTFFAGDKVVVYDKDNNKMEEYLNAIHEALGDHELALLKKKVIEPLHEKGYGNVFWAASESDPIEAFASSCEDNQYDNYGTCISCPDGSYTSIGTCNEYNPYDGGSCWSTASYKDSNGSIQNTCWEPKSY